MTRTVASIGLLIVGLVAGMPVACGESDEAPTQQELQERIVRLLRSRAGASDETASSESRTLPLPARRAIPSTAGAGSPSASGLQRRPLTEQDLRIGPSAVISLPRASSQPRQLSERDFLGNRLTIGSSTSTAAFGRRAPTERDFLNRR